MIITSESLSMLIKGARTAVASKVFWSQKTAGGDSDESPPALDGDFPIPLGTQISSVATRCAIAIFLLADAR